MSQSDFPKLPLTQNEVQFSALLTCIKTEHDEIGSVAVGKKIEVFIENCHRHAISTIAQNDSTFMQACCNDFENFEALFAAILDRLNSNLQQESYLEVSMLQAALQVIDVLIKELEMIISLDELKNITLENDKNIAGSTLNIIYESYCHCKTSETAYGQNFVAATTLLAELFRKTFNLQKMLSVLLSKVNTEAKCVEQDFQVYTGVCSRLFDVCRVVGNMDNTLLGSSWKLLLSFMSKCKPVLLGKLPINAYLLEIVTKVKEFLDRVVRIVQEDIKELSKGDSSILKTAIVSCRLAVFFSGLLGSLLLQYSAAINEEDYVILTEFVHSAAEKVSMFCMDDHTLPLNVRKLVTCQFLNELDKCLLIISSSSHFQSVVFERGTSNSSISRFVILVRLIKLLGNSDFDSSAWLGRSSEISSSIISVIFDLIPYLYCQFGQCKGFCMDDQELPLYETILIHLSACVIALPPTCFPPLETTLINNLLNAEPYRSILAADLWCFVARFVSPEICYHHVKLLLAILSNCSTTRSSLRQLRLHSLLKRLFKLLRSDHQEALLSAYPVAESTSFSFLSCCDSQLSTSQLGALSRDRATTLCGIVTNTANDWLEKDGTVHGLANLVTYSRVLGDVIEGTRVDATSERKSACNAFQKNFGNESAVASVVSAVTRLWKFVQVQSDPGEVFITFYANLSRLTSVFMEEHVKPEDVGVILQTVKALISAHPGNLSISLCFNIVHLVSSFWRRLLSQEAMEDLVFVWRELIGRTFADWLLRHKVLSSFEAFSKVTKQPEIIARVCSGQTTSVFTKREETEDLGAVVKSHLRQEVTPLEDGRTVADIFKSHQQALSVPDWLGRFNKPVVNNSRVREIVENITFNINLLKNISPDNIDRTSAASLRDALITIKPFLPD